MDWTGCEWVERVPGRMGGVPVVVGSRVTPESVVENFDGGMTVGQIAWNYSLPRSKVQGILEFVHRLAQTAA